MIEHTQSRHTTPSGQGPERGPRRRIGNRFPRQDSAEVGTLGEGEVRYRVEQALVPVHGFGKHRWESIGVTETDVGKREDDIVRALVAIITDPDRARNLNRSGAIALLGVLQRRKAVPLLRTVMESDSEQDTVRGWAALTLGRVGRSAAVDWLERSYESAPPLLRRYVVYGLEATRSRDALPVLRRVAREDASPVIGNKAIDAVRTLEKRFKLPRSRLRRRATGG